MSLTITPRDEALIALLREDARASVADLARRLGLSRTTVQDRLKRLEEGGVILGYDVRLADENRPGVSVLVLLEIEQRHIAGTVEAVCAIPEVETVHTVSGRFDLAVVAAAHSTGALDEVLDRIAGVDGVKRSESAVILATKLHRR